MPAVLLLILLLVAAPCLAQSRTFEQIAKDADSARAADRVPDSLRLYREGLRLRPRWGDGWWDLATLLYDQDRFGEAEVAFHRFIALTPKPGPAYAFLALCEYETHHYEPALQHFRSWASSGWPGTPQLIDVAVFHFALLLTRDGQFVRALYLFAPEAAKVGDDPTLVEAMGLASLRMQNLPEDYDPQKREMVWLAGEGAVYQAQQPHDFPRAEEYAARLVSRYPQQKQVHYFRGTLFTFENKNEDAEREYRQELRISPQNVPALLALADIDLDKNDLAEAGVLAKQAIELEPKNPEAHHVLGRVFLADHQLEPSAKELEVARQLAPDSPLVRSHLAMVYNQLGRTQEAKSELNAFVRLKGKEGILAPPQERLKPGPQEKTQ